jgi:hypothetical protein
MVSKEETPVLAGVLPAFEIFITKWETLAKMKPWLKPWIDEDLFWANKYYLHMDQTNAYVIAMCIRKIDMLPKLTQVSLGRSRDARDARDSKLPRDLPEQGVCVTKNPRPRRAFSKPLRALPKYP